MKKSSEQTEKQIVDILDFWAFFVVESARWSATLDAPIGKLYKKT